MDANRTLVIQAPALPEHYSDYEVDNEWATVTKNYSGSRVVIGFKNYKDYPVYVYVQPLTPDTKITVNGTQMAGLHMLGRHSVFLEVGEAMVCYLRKQVPQLPLTASSTDIEMYLVCNEIQLDGIKGTICDLLLKSALNAPKPQQSINKVYSIVPTLTYTDDVWTWIENHRSLFDITLKPADMTEEIEELLAGLKN